MKIMLIGYGNVGAAVAGVLSEQGHAVDYVVKKDGVYRRDEYIDNPSNLHAYISEDTTVFISVPSVGDGSEMLTYYRAAMTAGANVVTCEKAVIAHHWDIVEEFGDNIRYSATVGGNSGLLPALRTYTSDITELRAVVNGTLNYIAERKQSGATDAEVYREVTRKGFAEPGASTLEEVIAGEIKDVRMKAAILANHAQLAGTCLTPADVPFRAGGVGDYCSVQFTNHTLETGFIPNDDRSWFPSGVNNCLYVKGTKIAEGPGAGARITAERMYKDFLALNYHDTEI